MEESNNSSNHILFILFILAFVAIGTLFYLRSQDKKTVEEIQIEIANLNLKLNSTAKEESTDETASLNASEKTIPIEDTGWKNYKNDKFGFKLTFGDLWKGYQVKEETITDDKGTHFRVYLPTTDSQFSSNNPGYADPFVISVYKLTNWDDLLMQEGAKPTLIQKNGDYVYAYSTWQACPQDLCNTVTNTEIKNIIKTFNLNP